MQSTQITDEAVPDRTLLEVSGKDALPFLQGLVTNNVLPLAKDRGIVWTALLTPQGKYLSDFFVVNTGQQLLLDMPDCLAGATEKRLSMYRLRADVNFAQSSLHVLAGFGNPPAGAFSDPRHHALGWRRYSNSPGTAPMTDWAALRVANRIPESGIELIPDDSYILEHGFERLHGVDFRKGCYVGQEVTARMKHKTELRKGLAKVAIEGSAPMGAEITSDGKPVGQIFTQSNGEALAYLRFDRATGQMQAGDAKVHLMP